MAMPCAANARVRVGVVVKAGAKRRDLAHAVAGAVAVAAVAVVAAPIVARAAAKGRVKAARQAAAPRSAAHVAAGRRAERLTLESKALPSH